MIGPIAPCAADEPVTIARMASNARIAEQFEEIAQMLELLGEDRFRVNAHAKAARTIGDLAQDVASLAPAGDDKALHAALTSLDGVGKKVADKIVEFVRTGDMAEHRELRERVPQGLLTVQVKE